MGIAAGMARTKPKIYSVSQINSLIKVVLEENLPSRVVISGEVSGWKHHISGHCYFSLKDENAILPCVMWSSKYKSVKFSVDNGMAVLATGHIDLYSPGGKYQFYADKLEPAGVGALQLAFEQMVKRLKAQGLFDDEHKKALPSYPQRIGILTSESGAAVADIADSIYNRWPCVRLFLYPVPVQGEGAAEKIAAAIRDVNRRNSELKLDVLIVGRGGGSLEDLWAFNEEVLARAIFESQIAVVSAVGHEVDTTIADLVADARASTPTKAGVIVVPDMQEVLNELVSLEKRLSGEVRGQVEMARQNLRTVLASAAFKNPLLGVQNCGQQLDELSVKLGNSVKNLIAKVRGQLHDSYEKIVQIEPHRLLAKRIIELANLKNRVNTAVKSIINRAQVQLTARSNRLEGLNPKGVLQRGYSITSNKETGLLIRDLDGVNIGDMLITELAEEKLIESKATRKFKR